MKTYKQISSQDLKRRKYAMTYAKTLDKAKSYAAAQGHKKPTASDQHNAPRFHGDEKTQKLIDKYVRRVMDKLDITAEDVIRELGYIGFSNIARCMNEDGTWKRPNEIDPQTQQAIKGFMPDGAPIFWNKTQALELLAKRFGLLTMKNELTGAEGGVIKIQWCNENAQNEPKQADRDVLEDSVTNETPEEEKDF